MVNENNPAEIQIKIRQDQKDRLDSMKLISEEPYHKVLDRLLKKEGR